MMEKEHKAFSYNATNALYILRYPQESIKFFDGDVCVMCVKRRKMFYCVSSVDYIYQDSPLIRSVMFPSSGVTKDVYGYFWSPAFETLDDCQSFFVRFVSDYLRSRYGV